MLISKVLVFVLHGKKAIVHMEINADTPMTIRLLKTQQRARRIRAWKSDAFFGSVCTRYGISVPLAGVFL